MDAECRICLVNAFTSDHLLFKSILSEFESTGTSVKVSEAITKCTSVHIDPDDAYSKLICTDCLSNLEIAYNFRKLCIASHSKLKPNSTSCSICELQFESITNYNRHMEIHTGDRPYVCEECGKGFKYKSNLHEHKLSHTNNQQHPCNLCFKYFSTKCNLKQHILSKHSDPVFEIADENDDDEDYNPNNDDADYFNDFSDAEPVSVKVEELDFEAKDVIVVDMGPEEGEVPNFVSVEESREIDTNLKDDGIDHLMDARVEDVGDVFICSECSMVFKNQIQLDNHQKTHFTDDLSCVHCKAEFNSKEDLVKHGSDQCPYRDVDMNGPPPYKCFVCSKIMQSKSHFINHVRVHSKQRPFACKTCKKAFKQRSQLNIHLRIHTGEKPYKCPSCTQRFVTNSGRRAHISTHHPALASDGEALSNLERPTGVKKITDEHLDGRKMRGRTNFSCPICNKRFLASSALDNHIRMHSGDRPFVCEFCAKRFKQSAHLSIHRRSHTGEKNYMCAACSKSFITNSALKKHMEVRHSLTSKKAIPKDPTDKVYMCEQCGNTFPSSNQLKVHKKVHGTKSFFCEKCMRAYATEKDLERHMFTHTDEKPHECKQCGKRFKWRITAWRHSMYHTGAKPQKCTECDKSFIENGALRRHMRVHTGERPQKCEICFKAFKETSHLKSHILNIHKNEIPVIKIETK